MVKKIFIFFCFIFFVGVKFSTATESSVLAFRAQKSISSGKFAKGYSQLERALLASRKESDLGSEGRILISMAQIRIKSLDLNFADSLLKIVRLDALDENSSLLFTQTKISLANAREKFTESEKICKNIEDSSIKKRDETLKAAFYSECAIAYAGKKNESDAFNALKLVGKNADKKGGFYLWTSAKVSKLLGKSDADSLFQEAETKSIKAGNSYMTATILWERSQLKSVSKKESSDLKLRCKNAFELMGLPNNSKRCGR